MSPEIGATLATIPLGIIANLSSAKLQSFVKKYQFLENGLDRLFLDAFYTAIKQHNKHYDNTAKDVLDNLKKSIRADETRFLRLFSGEETIHCLNNESYLWELATAISTEYSFTDDKIVFFIIKDCLHDYIRCFFAHISEKEFMRIVLEDLFECKDNLNDILKVLSLIEERTEWLYYQYIRDGIFGYCSEIDEKYRNDAEEYDRFIQAKFKDLQLRGFTPRIGSESIAINLEDVFVPLKVSQEKLDSPYGYSSYRSIPEENGSLLFNQRSVLLGKPGSGKSTFLKYTAVNISKNRQNHKETIKNIIPILFKVSDYTEVYKTNRVSIHEFLCNNNVEKKFKQFIDITLTNSNAFVLIDGLDEVADKALRHKVAERIEEFISAYPKCQCIVTSRIIGYNEARLSANFTHFLLEDFTEPQIKVFSKNWIKTIHKDWTEEETDKDADELFNSIKLNESVFKLATNPLLMTIIAMIYFKGRRLPNNRIELYEYCTETFLESWVRLRINSDSQLKLKDEIIEILRPIAYDIHMEKSDGRIGERELYDKFKFYYKSFHTSASEDTAKKEAREFIEFLRDQAGFFYEADVSENGEMLFGFMHLTFEEYFAGMHLAMDFSEGGELWKEVLYKSRWIEILKLAVAHHNSRFTRKMTTEFIETIMNAEDLFPELGRKISLLCQLFSDDIKVNDDCKKKFLSMAVDYFASEWSRLAFDKVVYLALLNSNIGKEFWACCFDKIKSLDDEEVCRGVLFDVLLSKNADLRDEEIDHTKQYLSQASLDILKWIASNSSVREFESNISLHLFEQALKKIIGIGPEETELFDNYIKYCQTASMFDHLRNTINLLINSTKTDTQRLKDLKDMIIAIFLFNFAFYPHELLPFGFFTDNDIEFINSIAEPRSKHEFTSMCMFYCFSSTELWIVNIIEKAGKELSAKAFNIDTRKIFTFRYPYENDGFQNLPIDIQKRILAYSNEPSINIGRINEDCLFIKLKNLGFDLYFASCFFDYILKHVAEDTFFDSLYLVGCKDCYRNYLTTRASSVLTSTFKYEPSFPLQGLIKISRKEPVTKELLMKIREYTLNKTGLLRKASFNVLKFIVEDSLTSEIMR